MSAPPAEPAELELEDDDPSAEADPTEALDGVGALVLAAGFGTRLAPLTDQLPKPLIPVRGRPMVAYTLDRLEGQVDHCALNLHHLGEKIPEALGERWGELPLSYSPEPEILGTLGALAPLAERYGDCRAVVLVNGDSLCRWPIRRLLRRHRKGLRGSSAPRATLLLAAGPDPERYGGGVEVASDGRILALRRGGQRLVTASGEAPPGQRRLVFAGAHVLDPELLERAPHRKADIVSELYEPLLARGETLAAVVTRRSWHDLGTPGRYLEAVIGRAPDPALAGVWHRFGRRGVWIHPEAEVDPGARLSRVVVEAGVRIGRGARVHEAVLLPGARVAEGAEVRRALVAPGTEIPAGARVTDRLVARLRAGGTRPAGSSVMGGLLYAPLEPQRR